MKKNGFSLIELMIILGLSSVLIAVAVPINSNSLIKAKMSESDANLRKIRTQLRIFSNKTGDFPTLEKGSSIVGATWNEFEMGEMTGKYFSDVAYSIESNTATFTITCTTGKILPFDRTIDQSGMLANVNLGRN